MIEFDFGRKDLTELGSVVAGKLLNILAISRRIGLIEKSFRSGQRSAGFHPRPVRAGMQSRESDSDAWLSSKSRAL